MTTPMSMNRPNVAGYLPVLARAVTLAGLLLGASPALADPGPPIEGAMALNFRLMEPPVPAPDVAVELPDGELVSPTDFAGQVVLLNFWATWCAPCIREMPALEQVQAELADEGLVVMTVSEDRRFEQIEGFFAERGFEWLQPYLDRDGKLAQATAVKGLPTTLIIGRDGKVAGGMQGEGPWASEDAKALLRWYLEQPAVEEPVKTSG